MGRWPSTVVLGLGAICFFASAGCIYHDIGQREVASSQTQPGRDAATPPVALVPGAPGAPAAPGGDYLATRMTQVHAQFGQGRPAVSALLRASLGTSETRDFTMELATGHCYTVIGVGTPQVQDLDLFLFDPRGALIGQDQETDNFPVVAYCPTASGAFRVQAKVYAGSGEFGLQLFGNGAAPPGAVPTTTTIH